MRPKYSVSLLFPFLFCLLVIVSFTGSAFSQGWTAQNSGTNVNLNSVAFPDTNNGWIVGNDGIIIHTTNGGTTWITQTSGTTNSLKGVAFTDTNNGWIVCSDVFGNGIVINTTNGGTTWTSQIGGGYGFTGVKFYDSTHGWAVGRNGEIAHTSDGTSWRDQFSGTVNDLSGVEFVNANTGWAVGGIILHTTDSGETWNIQTYNPYWGASSVNFANVNYGWSIGIGNSIVNTTNGGTTWTSQTNGSTSMLIGIKFVDTNNGWIVGNNGTIIHTTNGGNTWMNQTSGTTRKLSAISFCNANNGWVIGDSGTILHYAPTVLINRPNGGESFRIGSQDTIRWSSSGVVGNVRIELNRNYPSGTWDTLFANTANDSIELWTVTGPSTPTARIRILSVNNPAIGDTSNGDFRIFNLTENLHSSLTFDGVSNYVEIPNSGAPQGNSDRTIEIWVKTSLNSGDNWFFHYGDTVATNTGVIFITNNGALGIAYYGNGWGVSYIGGNLWHHITLTYSSNHTNIYVDGTLIISDTQLPLNTVGSKIRLGIPLFSNGGRYSGLLSELRIWNYARTQTQIQQNMYTNLAGTDPGLVGYWRLNEGSGTTVYNDVAGGANGTIYGATWSTDVPRAIKLTSPNTPVQLAIGALDTIQWTSYGFTGNVNIDLNRNYPSGTWENIFSNTPNDGSQPWTVTGPYTAAARMRITSVDTPLVGDTSDVNFVIGIVPAAPGNFVVTTQGEDAHLSWGRVDTSISGFPITVQRYLIYYRSVATNSWQYLWATFGADSTSFTHIGVVRFSPAMYYQVTAWMGGTSSDRVIRGIPVGTPKREVERMLGE